MSSPHDAWLAEAVDAARECAHDESPASLEGAATRLRIHASLERRRGSSKRRLTVISAIVASMFGSTAFAYFTGWRPFAPATEPARPTAAPAIEHEAPARARTGPGPSVPVEPPPLAPAAPPGEPAPPVLAAPPAAAPPRATVGPPARRPRVLPEPAVRPAAPLSPATTPAPGPDAELAAYQQAHDAHFKGGDPAAALAAWDRYLAQYPSGELAPEARYDRALVLVKLARWSEARAALAPFASAPVGAYRQREAARILAAIRDR